MLSAAPVQIKPRRAKLRISAPTPKSHGGQSWLWRMRLASRPSFSALTVTTSPGLWVKPLPGASRSATGANVAPRKSAAPSGVSAAAVEELAHELGGVAADCGLRRAACEREAVLAFDSEVDFGAAHVVEREGCVEQPQERAARAVRVLVLGLAQQQRRAALEIAQVDVVAERRADDRAL
jgi:hypothetical protein